MPRKAKGPLDPSLREPNGTVRVGGKLGGGRPTGSKNVADMRFRILNELIPATIAGKKKNIPAAEAAFRKLVQSALQGDKWAIGLVLREWSKFEEKQAKPPEPAYIFSEADRTTILEVYERMKAFEPAAK